MVKLEKPRQPLGGEGDVWVSLRAAFQRLASSFRVSAAAGAGAHRAKSEARGRRGGAAGRMVPGRGALGCLQRAQGQPCSLRSRPLAPRPPLPAPGRRGPRRSVRPLRARPLAPLWKTRRPSGALAAKQGRAQELPQLAKPLSSAALALLQRRPLSGVERSCSPRRTHLGARTCAGPWRCEAGRGRAGPRHLSASQRRPRPAHLFSAPRKMQTVICLRKGKPRNPRHFSCRQGNWQIGSAMRRLLRSIPRAGSVWKLNGRQGCLRDSWPGLVYTIAFESLADVCGWRPLN